MADPFRPDAKSQLLREAQIGLSVVAVLLAILVYVAFFRITGRGRQIPEHVLNAPVAKTAWPDVPPHVAADLVANNRREESAQNNLLDGRGRLQSRDLVTKQNSNSQPFSPIQNSQAFDSDPPSSRNRQPKNTVQNSTPFPMVQAQTSDSTGFPMKPDRKNYQREKPEWNVKTANANELAKLAELKAPPVAASDHGFQVPKIQSSVTSDFATPLNGKPTDANSNTVLPVGFENELREFGSHPGEQANSKTDSKAQDPNNAFPTPPAAPPSESVLGTVKKSQIANQSKAETKAEETQSEPDKNSTSDPPILIAPQPFLIGNDFESAKPLNKIKPGPVLPGKPKAAPADQTQGSTNRSARLDSRTYIVQAGDSFWSIAEHVYGDGRFFRALYRYNEPLFPNFDSLTAGSSVGTPIREDLIKLFPNDCPPEETKNVADVNNAGGQDVPPIYVTRKGETLFEIARQKLGQASRYLEIKQLNRFQLDSQTNHLTPLRQGIRLVLPSQAVK
jgi:nucleoid-associated protein YgaU